MDTRMLPRKEYYKLVGTELEPVRDTLPENAHVFVAEDRGMVVGTWSLIPIYHAEGIWVHPDYRRKFAVAKSLIRGMRMLANALGVKVVVTTALNPGVERLVQHMHGDQLPGKHFLIKVA